MNFLSVSAAVRETQANYNVSGGVLGILHLHVRVVLGVVGERSPSR
jgi:hypothetical protein